MAKATTKTKPATKRRKPGRKPVLVGHYTLEIDTWQVGYSFAAGEGRDFTRGPYYEHLDLEITAHFLEPDQHQGKSVNMVLLGNRGVDALMDEDDPRCDQAKSVGHLDV